MRLVFNTSCGLGARASTEHARGAPEALVQPTSRAGGTPNPALSAVERLSDAERRSKESKPNQREMSTWQKFGNGHQVLFRKLRAARGFASHARRFGNAREVRCRDRVMVTRLGLGNHV